MLKLNKSLLLLLFIAVLVGNKVNAQIGDLNLYFQSYVFDKDSLLGFDEEAARKAAISQGFTGIEFPGRMFALKRAYINARYGIEPVIVPYAPPVVARTAVVPGCSNEDFEASTAGNISSNTAITGWSLSSGSNYSYPTVTSCNLAGCCAGTTSASAIFTTPFTDNIIGTQYPIYSVFGTSTTNTTAAAAANPQISQQMKGDKIIRINNSQTQDYGIERLTKTFAVTQNNALFQFAFISVFATNHECCDAASFRIRLYNASGGNTLIPCPTFSVSAPSTQCAAGPGTPNYVTAANGAGTGGGPVTASSAYIYNPWQISSIDLTPYINSNITIEIIVTDCDQGGHYGYCYFDAQCGPMTIYGNDVPFAAGNTTATVPTCGTAGATLCAVDGLGPFSWAGPGVGPPYTTPSFANQCYTTNLSGTFTLYMNPAGSCAPISRPISTNITPAPLLGVTAHQAVCGSTLSAVTITPSGSASVPSTIVYTPTPLSQATNSLSSTYTTGAIPPYNVTVTATDPLGCAVSATAQIRPSAPLPTFTLNNVTGTSSITCTNHFVELIPITTYTYNTLTYSFTGANGTPTVGDDVGLYVPGVYTVIASEPTSTCVAVLYYTVGTNTVAPVLALTPTLQNITCASTASTVTLTSTSPTLNLAHWIYSPSQGPPAYITSSVVIYQPFPPGDYRDSLVNLITGCSTVRHFSISSNDVFPGIVVTSPQQFTLGCGTRSVATINLTSTNSNGTIKYNLSFPTATAPPSSFNSISLYTTNVAGTYTAYAQDPVNSCVTGLPFSVIANNFGPDIHATVPLNYLSCFTPTMQLTAVTANTLVSFQWSYKNNGNGNVLSVANPTVLASTNTNVTNPIANTFTLTITDLTNDCISTMTVPVLQNQYPPKAGIVAADGSPTPAISCARPNIQLNSNSFTSIPPNSGFPTNQNIVAMLWEGPSPQTPGTFTSNYQAYVAGPYTLTVRDMNNGCTSFTTLTVIDNRLYPIFKAVSPFTLDCGAANVPLSAPLTFPTTTTTANFHWSPPDNAPFAGVNPDQASIPVTASGNYVVAYTHTNGCVSSTVIPVVNGGLTADFTPDVTSGFAPLTVTFNNTSHSSLSSTASNSITSVWNYGNGISTTSLGLSSPYSGTAVYTQPGNYQVTLYTTKGSCSSVITKTITVDIPSKLEIPNVFTPNGDGVNDLFFLKVANMSEITATIYDRWGRKVYELTSQTGNIAWDGTNMVGTKVAAGVYFYVVKGTGKDGQSYDTKGSVTLFK